MDIVIIALAVGLASAYVGKKLWDLVRPGPKAAGCGCSGSTKKAGCAGCPMMDLIKRT